MTETLQIENIHREAFVEMANIGIGRAADVMSKLAGKRVSITVPDVVFAETQSSLLHQFRDELNPSIIIEQDFFKDMNGVALLLLTKDGALRLSQLILGEDAECDALGEMEQGAILELGNIMICNFMGSLSNMLDFKVQYAVPEMQLEGLRKVDILQQNTGSLVAILKCDLAIDVDKISSSLLINMSNEEFLKVINQVKSKFFEN